MGEVIIPDRIEPSWKVHSNFITEHLARALALDSLRSSHPIEMPCPDEDTIQQVRLSPRSNPLPWLTFLRVCRSSTLSPTRRALAA